MEARPAVRMIALVGLGLAAFVGVAALVRAAAPLEPPVGIREKLAAFERDRDAVDVLFFGSSHVHRGIDPRAFDAALARAGRPLHSFNLGVPAMGAHEANALLRAVLAREPARLRWVVIEWQPWRPTIHPENRFKDRPVFWHDFAETRSAIAGVWRLRAPLPAKLELAAVHALHLLQRALAVGRGPEALAALVGRGEPAAAPPRKLARTRGFGPFEPDEYLRGPTAEHRQTYLDDPAGFAASVRALPAGNRRPVDLSTANRDALAAQIDLVRAAGAEPIYLVPPSHRPEPLAYALYETGAIPHLLAFNDPLSYPELYRADLRFDRGHLNDEGAERFSRLLAERFAAEILAAEPRD